MENKLSLIISITNNGFSEQVMEVAKNKGARGGTFFNAFGSASLASEKLYGININPEKEVVMILVSSKIVDSILRSLYENVGPNTKAQGIAFTLDVNNATSNLTKQYIQKSKIENKNGVH